MLSSERSKLLVDKFMLDIVRCPALIFRPVSFFNLIFIFFSLDHSYLSNQHLAVGDASGFVKLCNIVSGHVAQLQAFQEGNN